MENCSIKDTLLKSAASRQWEAIGIKNHHGIAVALFSIHSKASSGIGEYLDLIYLIDWCREIGFDVIQLLPLNDTGLETSPYNALSAFALNPIHLRLIQLPGCSQDETLSECVKSLQSSMKGRSHIDYPFVQKKKELFLRRYYRLYGSSIQETDDFLAFRRENGFWLDEYAFFKGLKVIQHWQPWESWPEMIRNPSPSLLESPPEEAVEEIAYQIFVQYLCHSQFMQVKRHAEEKGVFLKGDIPILISRESVDVWKHPKFFLLDLSAGAPPDMYSDFGQKWGFPPYNWDALKEQGYQWWISRLNEAAKYYHLYRIDHIVGFFRIWGIPRSLPPRDGRFIPEDQNRWIPEGSLIMKTMLENCDMLPIGEDLGVVPPEVKAYLRSIGICGTKVMRWERLWDTTKEFIDPKCYPKESMTTVSTHDTETLKQWWRDRPDEACLFAKMQKWTYTPELTQDQRISILKASHRSNSLFHINLISEYLAINPEMVWPNDEDERINVPGTISERNWSYLMRPSLEEIVENSDLKGVMREFAS